MAPLPQDALALDANRHLEGAREHCRDAFAASLNQLFQQRLGGNRNTAWARQMRFDMICEAHDIEHRRLTKPNHPWTNGQVERKNRTIKEATIKRFHYDSHEQLRTLLADYMAAYNYARRLKTPSGLTPYE